MDFVRVYVPESDSDVSISRDLASSLGLQVLRKPAVSNDGVPLPPKPHAVLGSKRRTTGKKG